MFRLAIPRLVQLARPTVTVFPRLTPLCRDFSNRRRAGSVRPSNKPKSQLKDVVREPQKETKKPDKQTVAELLKEIDLSSDIVSEEETKKLKELDHILSESPELKNMSMDEIIGMLNISEDDKKSLTEQVNQIISNEKMPMSDEEIHKEFPGIEKESVEVIKALDEEISKNPDFRRDFFAWTQQVQQSLGPNMEKLKTLGEDELARIATPPDDLRVVLDRIMPNVEGIESAMRMDAKDIWKDEETGEDVEVEEIKIKLSVC